MPRPGCKVRVSLLYILVVGSCYFGGILKTGADWSGSWIYLGEREQVWSVDGSCHGSGGDTGPYTIVTTSRMEMRDERVALNPENTEQCQRDVLIAVAGGAESLL